MKRIWLAENLRGLVATTEHFHYEPCETFSNIHVTFHKGIILTEANPATPCQLPGHVRSEAVIRGFDKNGAHQTECLPDL